MIKLTTSLSSLCQYLDGEKELVSDRIVKNELLNFFDKGHCYDFSVDEKIIKELQKGKSINRFKDQIITIKNTIYDRIAKNDTHLHNILLADSRLSLRLGSAIAYIHMAIAENNLESMISRRFVLVKEKPNVPTIYHVSSKTTVLAHVGFGPDFQEIPSVYLGLKIFDTLDKYIDDKELDLFSCFRLLLNVESRAIETGYAHIEPFPPLVENAINKLLHHVLELDNFDEEIHKRIFQPKVPDKFSKKDRLKFLNLLNARNQFDELNFNYDENLKAVVGLERLAKKYKKHGDEKSLNEIVRLLVSASGHDIHEIRSRANILLERCLSPKEFSAPLATSFVNLQRGNRHKFEFDIPVVKNGYVLRIFRNNKECRFNLETKLDYFDLDLPFDKSRNLYSVEYEFEDYGHYDFLVYKNSTKGGYWIDIQGTSGRINVIPGLEGELVLEIFPDIHGHSGIYWNDDQKNPGLVYNEHGEVIRLGRFSDITSHLKDLVDRYSLTALYILGIQKRGSNRENWAAGATSPSPFSPMSLIELEPSLGGESGFMELVRHAHDLGIKVIVDIIPHLNKASTELPENLVVKCYDDAGQLVTRGSTDGKFGSWDDGKLYNYRCLETWDWIADSIVHLIEKYNIDGIRFDSAHAVPIMLKKNNFPMVYDRVRSAEEQVEGHIIVNDRENDHMITTGYYDSSCRELIAPPFHYYVMLKVERKLKTQGKNYFLNIAECYWGHERFLTRTGLIPYNSSLFKICENIIHGKTDVREIYHIYNEYFPAVLPVGTELLGILGNHDERRALNTFGYRGLRAAIAITIFMSSIVMDYEGSAEGESWKVYLDNIYVNWNQFEQAANRSLALFYKKWYDFHRNNGKRGYLIWANNNMVAAAMTFSKNSDWVGVFNFSDTNQSVALQFDNKNLLIEDSTFYRISDTVYSQITSKFAHFTGKELKSLKFNTVVSANERIKLLRLEKLETIEEYYSDFLYESLYRISNFSNQNDFVSNFFFNEISVCVNKYTQLRAFLINSVLPLFDDESMPDLFLGLKRSIYYLFESSKLDKKSIVSILDNLKKDENPNLQKAGESLTRHFASGAIVFISAEANPFSKSGGLANVVYELPRELVKSKEKVYVFTGLYCKGNEKELKRMDEAVKLYNIEYTGINVSFYINGIEYTVGVHSGIVDNVVYYLFKHHELFDGLYWGTTAAEKLIRRIALARASAEVIVQFNIEPLFVFTNDAYAGIFNGIVKCDPVYANNANFKRTSFLMLIHNGGWQYFDSYYRYEKGVDLFSFFGLPNWHVSGFTDPQEFNKLNNMATGIRYADSCLTVSPSYARQIEYASDGLEYILHDVKGISNAIGYDFADKLIQRFYNSGFQEQLYPELVACIAKKSYLKKKLKADWPEIIDGIDAIKKIKNNIRKKIVERVFNKMLLQVQRGLVVDPGKVMFVMIHRVCEQKGFQILLEASHGIFSELGFQAIIGGPVAHGDNRAEEMASGLIKLPDFYPGQVSVDFDYQDIAAPLLGADFFCMPSMSEPGGISQLEAFAVGCPVLARATGGLKDTVFPIIIEDGKLSGNGFLFSDFTAHGIYDAMYRANEFFHKYDTQTIQKMRDNAEKTVYFWDKPAREYLEYLYKFKEIVRLEQ